MDARVYLTRWDVERLKGLIEAAVSSASRDSQHLRDLGEKLKSGVIVEPERIPSDTVTMNSRVLLKDLDTGKTMIYSIVYPENADVGENKISILAPIGTALIGKQTGDVVEWHVPAGLRRLRIMDILYQPEAHGQLYY